MKRILLWIIILIASLLILFIIAGHYGAKNAGSFLPETKPKYLRSRASKEDKIQLENPWYILEVEENGDITVRSTKREIIMSNLTYYSEYEGINENWGLDSVTVYLSNDSTVSITGKGSAETLVNVLLTVSKNNPRMDVRINTHYNMNATVCREALIAEFNIPLSEVYLKNRRIDFKPFAPEYWLQRQGVRFGNGSKSSLIYGTPHISSLQLKSKSRELAINLEYYLDHPTIHIPYEMNGTRNWLDYSLADYTEGSERNDFFSIYFGDVPEVIPRLMLVPQGYLAGYVFTEHADGGNIRTHRAAYFGSENITDPENATGGFVGHRIPVTKSVFYADTTGGPSGSSIRDDKDYPQFLNFLDKLYATGDYDICLHSPEDYSSDRETLTEAIKFMKERYETETWIDHGLFPGKLNRESFICEGLDPNSDLYAADLWEEYDTRFFWNPAVETLRKRVSPKEELKNLNVLKLFAELWRRLWYLHDYQGYNLFSAFFKLLNGYFPMVELNSLQPSRGNSYPTPLYWQNITRTGQFYTWPTEFVYGEVSPSMAENQLINEKRQLEMLKSNRGIFINHGYYVRNGVNDFVLSEKNGEYVISPYFDQVLNLMAKMRDEGDLYITTIKDLLNYWILTENISFEYKSDGTIYILNNNEESVKNLSLVLNADADDIRINNEIPASRQAGEDAIIWFDMPAKGHVCLQVVSDPLSKK